MSGNRCQFARHLFQGLAVLSLLATIGAMAQPAAPMPRCTAVDQPLRLLSEADYAAQVRRMFAARQVALSADSPKTDLARSLGRLDLSQQAFNPRAAHQLLSLRDEEQSRLLRDDFAGAPGPLQDSLFERQRRIWASAGIEAARLPEFGFGHFAIVRC